MNNESFNESFFIIIKKFNIRMLDLTKDEH